MQGKMTSNMIEDDGVDNQNPDAQDRQPRAIPTKKRIKWWLLLLYCTCAAVGTVGGPLLQRLYYKHGGSRKWLSSWLQSAGFAFLVAPLSFLYLRKLSRKRLTATFFMEPKLFIFGSVLGILLGLDNYMYSAGLFYIPVSTSALLFSTQLAFTALFAFLLVKQRFTFYSLNSVVVMTLGSAVLALHTSSDRPPGVSKGKYLFGFFFTLGGAALLGLSLPLIELAYSKSSKPVTYTVVMQFQFVMSFFATILCTVGMLINKDFEKIPREARDYGIGEVKYYVVLMASAVTWQLLFLGLIGVIHCTSSLFAGILTAVLLPLTEVAAVITYHEKFTGEKGMALALCLWGFTSYSIGEYKNASKKEPIIESNQDYV